MTTNRTLAIAFAGALLTVAGYLALSQTTSNKPEATDSEAARSGCGVERWPVKTMTDPLAAGVNLTPVNASIGDLIQFPKAPKNATTRLPAEESTYHIDAQLQSVKMESDGDYHLVLTSDGKSMIAEAPDPNCARGSVVASQIAAVRQKVAALCQPVTTAFVVCKHNVWVTGVLFLDFLHGQTGVALNGAELHPITDFVVTDGKAYP